MNKSMSPENSQVRSRRGFLGTICSAGAFVLGAQLLPSEAQAAKLAADTAWHPGIWLGLEPRTHTLKVDCSTN